MQNKHKTEIRWLHISDFHLRESQGWAQDVVLNSLLDDIRIRYSDQNKPDLLFITGDLAHSGKTEEYVLVENFVRLILDSTSLDTDRLFIVPGNHDVDRTIEEDAFIGVRTVLKNPTEVDKFFANEERRRTLLRRQEAFRKFVNKIAPPDNGGYTPTSFAHSKSTTVGSINVRALLLDSAWLSEGGPSDNGTLLIGERQVIDAHGTTELSSLTFGLVHHPLPWLRDFEHVAIENLLIDRVNVLLQGHLHSNDVRSVEALQRRLTVFTTGASFETRTSDNSYSWGSVDLLTGKGRLVIHKYVQATKRWQTSAPQPWKLLNISNPSIPVKEALEVLIQAGGDFLYYRVSLLSGHSTEIPRYIGDKIVYLNYEADIPDEINHLGKIVANIRHLFYWRQAWSHEKWNSELERLNEQFQEKLKEMEATSNKVAEFLADTERNCHQVVQFIIGDTPEGITLPVVDEIIALGRSAEWSKALEVIHRWSSQDVLTPEEKHELSRIEVRVLLELNRASEAVGKIKSILEGEDPPASDLLLAANCCYTEREYQTACKYMHMALDKGVDPESVRTLAMAIAGQAGDSTLVKRVS